MEDSWLTCLRLTRDHAGPVPPSSGRTVLLVETAAPGEMASADSAFERLVVSAGSDDLDVLLMLAERFPGTSIAYARCGTELEQGWDEALARAACESGVGAVSALSDAVPFLDPFPQPRPDWMGSEAVGRWITTLTRGHVFDVPGVLPLCAWLRADALRDLLATREFARARGLAAALHRAGWTTVACDWVFAGWRSPLGEHPWLGDSADARAMLAHPPLARIRHALGEAIERGVAAIPPPRRVAQAVQLHVTHSWGGGLGRWIRDMCEADAVRSNLVLRSIGTWGAFGQRIALYASHEMDVPLREWQLDQPIRSVAPAHQQYRRILQDVVQTYDVDVVLVSSLIGHSLDALDSGRRTLVALHDYFPFCPALVIRFDEVCTRCDEPRLRACFADNPLNRFFGTLEAADWIALRERYTRLMQSPSVSMVAPSASVLHQLRSLEPQLRAVPGAVVENGLDMAGAVPVKPPEGRLQLVVLGSLAPHKGLDLLLEALPRLLVRADLHVLGCGEEGVVLEGYSGVRVRRHYRPDELPALLASIRPHAGLLLSIVPETFSYTLSELWACGIPPVATRLGSFADRIRDRETGFLIAPTADDLVATLEEIDRNRDALQRITRKVCEQPRHGRADMVEGYHRLTPLPRLAGRIGPQVPQREGAHAAHGALHVNVQAPFRLVCADFLLYAEGKVRATPRLGRIGRAGLIALLQLVRYVVKAR